MPAYWEYPFPPIDYPYYWFILDPTSKQDKSKLQILKICQKLKFCNFVTIILYVTHLLKLFDKMYRYEISEWVSD